MTATLPALRPLLRACLMLGAAMLIAIVAGCGYHGGGSSGAAVDGALTFIWEATSAPAVSPATPTSNDAVTLIGRLRCSTVRTITSPVRVLVTIDGTTVLDTTVAMVLTVAQNSSVAKNLYTVDLSLPLGRLGAGTDRALTVSIDPGNTFGSPVQNVSTKSFTRLVTVAPAALI
ncbi:MAG: hypothetical protein H0X38_05915 [Planctomycetes bacterium]|nr:hypothetical protein [Planctomycetota bacterium]